MLQAAALLPLCHRGSPRVWALAEQLRSPKFSAANAFSRAWHNLPGRPTFLSFLNSALGSAEACTNPNGHTEARPVLRCNAKVKLGSQRVPKGPKSPKPCEPLQAFRRHYLQSDCGTNQAFQAEGMLAMQVAESNKPRYSASWPQWGMTSRYSASQWTNCSHTIIGSPQTHRKKHIPASCRWDLSRIARFPTLISRYRGVQNIITVYTYFWVFPPHGHLSFIPLRHSHWASWALAAASCAVPQSPISFSPCMEIDTSAESRNITNKAHVSEFWSLLISSDQFCSVQPRHWDPICRAVHTVAEQRPISQLPHRLNCRIRETEHSQPLLRLQPIRPPPRISPTSWPPRPKAYNAKDADLFPAVCFSVNCERQHNLYIWVVQ